MTSTSQRPESKGLRTQWRRAWSTRQPGATMLSPALRTDLEREYGDLSHLRRVGTRPPLREYFTELVDRRHFVWAGARGEALTRYSNERLGVLWHVIRPMLDAAFYGVIFGIVLQMSRGMDNYVAFVIIGIFMFQLSARAISGGATLIRNSKAMIRAFAFPRATLAVSDVLRELMTSMPAIGVMIAAVMVIPPHELPTASWALFPVVLALHSVLNLGFVLFFGWLGSVMPDLAQAVGFATRILMYASAVIFPIDRFVDHPSVLAVVQANPIYVVLDMYRTVLISGGFPAAESWLLLCAWAFGTLFVGFSIFWWNEERYGRE